MRRSGLTVLLVTANVALVVAAVLAVGAEALRQLRHLADREAMARVRLGARNASWLVERSRAELEVAARSLAERLALQRPAPRRPQHELAMLLDTFARAEGISACALQTHSGVIAQSSSPLAWDRILGRIDWEGESTILEAHEEGGPLLVARAPVDDRVGMLVHVARFLDDRYARGLSEQIGLTVRIVDRTVALESEGPERAVREEVVDSGAGTTVRVGSTGSFVSVLPLSGGAGSVVAVVETVLATADDDASRSELTRHLLGVALVVAALAALAAGLLARGLVGPLGRLTEAAARIGRGDLTSAVSRAGVAEVGALAAAMEDMRGRVLRLTVELQRRQAEAEAVLSGIEEGVFAVDRDRRIRYMNPQAASLLRIGAMEVVGRFCGDVLNPQIADGGRPCEENCPIVHARFRGSTRATEFLLLPGGARRTVIVASAPPPPSRPGEAVDSRQIQVIRDEADLEASRRLRDAVVANISHEFRTPLSAQLASIELLREKSGETFPPESQELLASLERGTLRLARLVDNLLESLRIDAGRDSIRLQAVALDQVLEEAVELTGPLIAQRRQKLEIELPYPLPAVNGDAARLAQVFVNLLANANKFAPEDSTIRVAGEVRATEVEMWVEDEGPGLPPGSPAALFERFVRSPGEEPEEGGMGLGLWIVKSIIERHGGRVEACDSGRGTRISAILPRRSAGENLGR